MMPTANPGMESGVPLKIESILRRIESWMAWAKYSDTKITRISRDHLSNDFWWMNHLKVRWNKRNEVEGFDVNSGRIMHLKFDKVK